MRRSIFILSLAAAGCGDTSAPVLPEGTASGSRLGLQVADGGQGAVHILGFFDRATEQSCAFVLTDNHGYRCLPNAHECDPNTRFVQGDNAVYQLADTPCAESTAGTYGGSGTLTIPGRNGNLTSNGQGGQVSGHFGSRPVIRKIPLTEFVGGQLKKETLGRLTRVTLLADDGAQIIWSTEDTETGQICYPLSDRCSPNNLATTISAGALTDATCQATVATGFVSQEITEPVVGILVDFSQPRCAPRDPYQWIKVTANISAEDVFERHQCGDTAPSAQARAKRPDYRLPGDGFGFSSGGLSPSYVTYQPLEPDYLPPLTTISRGEGRLRAIYPATPEGQILSSNGAHFYDEQWKLPCYANGEGRCIPVMPGYGTDTVYADANCQNRLVRVFGAASPPSLVPDNGVPRALGARYEGPSYLYQLTQHGFVCQPIDTCDADLYQIGEPLPAENFALIQTTTL